MMERKLVRNLDAGLLTTVVGLTLLGLVVIYSATHSGLTEGVSDRYYFVKRQAIAAAVGFAMLTAILTLDYRVLGKAARVIYGCSFALLLAVLVMGRTVAGTKGWLILGPIGIQPAEFAKIGVIIFLAKMMEGRDDLHTVRGIASVLAWVCVPMLLILKQPDFGTAMVFSGIVSGMLYVAGVPLRFFLGLVGSGLGAIGTGIALSHFGFIRLFDQYQINRILVFLDPHADATGAGWNVIQSMIAIGSGRFFGKGLFSGSQTQLNFLPARHTDFIFSVIGEEFGFLGAVLVLLGYFYLVWRGIHIISEAKDQFGSLVATGIVSMLLFHLLVNVGMTLGIMPVTGIPLPFLSAGGSALLANLMGAAILLNIHMRRQKILF